MTFTLPDLPYAYDALAPHMSKETFEYHHDKHHMAYIAKANELIAGSDLEGKSLIDAMMAAHKDPAKAGLFNQLGQHYNHSLFWESMAPNGGKATLSTTLEAKIAEDFGNYDNFKEKFIEAGMTQFGSGWCWLVLNKDSGKLEVTKTANGDTPLTDGKTPLLVCDVWEHAYYIDYRNARPKFLEVFMDHLVNWDNVEKLLQGAQ